MSQPLFTAAVRSRATPWALSLTMDLNQCLTQIASIDKALDDLAHMNAEDLFLMNINDKIAPDETLNAKNPALIRDLRVALGQVRDFLNTIP